MPEEEEFPLLQMLRKLKHLLADAGAAYVIYGPLSSLTGVNDIDDLDATRLSGAASERAGWSVAGGHDINEDGYDDVLVGSIFNDGNTNNAGAAFLVLGSGD